MHRGVDGSVTAAPPRAIVAGLFATVGGDVSQSLAVLLYSTLQQCMVVSSAQTVGVSTRNEDSDIIFMVS